MINHDKDSRTEKSKNEPITVEKMKAILDKVEPKSLIIFENQSKSKNKTNNTGKEIIKDVIIQKQEFLNGDVSYNLILVNEFLNLHNSKKAGQCMDLLVFH